MNSGLSRHGRGRSHSPISTLISLVCVLVVATVANRGQAQSCRGDCGIELRDNRKGTLKYLATLKRSFTSCQESGVTCPQSCPQPDPAQFDISTSCAALLECQMSNAIVDLMGSASWDVQNRCLHRAASSKCEKDLLRLATKSAAKMVRSMGTTDPRARGQKASSKCNEKLSKLAVSERKCPGGLPASADCSALAEDAASVAWSLLRSCDEQLPSATEIESAVAAALLGLTNPFDDPEQFARLLNRIEFELGCRVRSTDVIESQRVRLVDAGIQYCGPGTSIDNPSLTAFQAVCMNPACAAHDACYPSTCIDASACMLSAQSSAPCDAALFDACASCESQTSADQLLCAAARQLAAANSATCPEVPCAATNRTCDSIRALCVGTPPTITSFVCDSSTSCYGDFGDVITLSGSLHDDQGDANAVRARAELVNTMSVPGEVLYGPVIFDATLSLAAPVADHSLSVPFTVGQPPLSCPQRCCSDLGEHVEVTVWGLDQEGLVSAPRQIQFNYLNENPQVDSFHCDSSNSCVATAPGDCVRFAGNLSDRDGNLQYWVTDIRQPSNGAVFPGNPYEFNPLSFGTTARVWWCRGGDRSGSYAGVTYEVIPRVKDGCGDWVAGPPVTISWPAYSPNPPSGARCGVGIDCPAGEHCAVNCMDNNGFPLCVPDGGDCCANGASGATVCGSNEECDGGCLTNTGLALCVPKDGVCCQGQFGDLTCGPGASCVYFGNPPQPRCSFE